jgi:hypothetical protein
MELVHRIHRIDARPSLVRVLCILCTGSGVHVEEFGLATRLRCGADERHRAHIAVLSEKFQSISNAVWGLHDSTDSLVEISDAKSHDRHARKVGCVGCYLPGKASCCHLPPL